MRGLILFGIISALATVVPVLGAEALAQGRKAAVVDKAKREKMKAWAARQREKEKEKDKPKRGRGKGEGAVEKSTESAGGSAEAQAAAAPPTRGPSRIDFDPRLLQGQTNKAGAVYLYDRKELKTLSMIRERESFRDEILAEVYDR